MMKKINFFPWLMMASLKLGTRKNSLLLRRETRAEAQSANKIGEKAQTNLWGYPEEGGLLNFEDE